MLIIGNLELQAVTTLHMILVIIKYLKSYLEKFTTEIYKKMGQKGDKTNLMGYLVLSAHTPQRRKNISKQRIGSWIMQKKFAGRK